MKTIFIMGALTLMAALLIPVAIVGTTKRLH
jgi:hypothetical protein